jgi:nucleoside-diphosphate-sugar epimerase
MAAWLWAILEFGETGGIYDVGSDLPITMLELAKKIIRETRSSSEIVVEGGLDPMPHYLPENTAMTRELLKYKNGV